jgi:hypothetical protein
MWWYTLHFLLVAAGTGAPAGAGDFEPGVKLEADGKPVDVEIGHAAPFYADMDGDGVKDLLVGQFGEGKLRIYRNVGSHSAPKFDDFTMFQAGGADATVPFGWGKETPEEARGREAKLADIMDEMQTIQEQKLQPLMDKLMAIQQRLPSRQGTHHGFVWLYLRKAAAPVAAAGT